MTFRRHLLGSFVALGLCAALGAPAIAQEKSIVAVEPPIAATDPKAAWRDKPTAEHNRWREAVAEIGLAGSLAGEVWPLGECFHAIRRVIVPARLDVEQVGTGKVLLAPE